MDRLEQRVAKIESDLAVLKWMVGSAVALAVANLISPGRSSCVCRQVVPARAAQGRPSFR